MVDGTVTKTLKVLITVVAFALVLILAYRLRTVLGWLAIGAFLAVIINPAVSKLTRHMPGKRRGLGVASVIILGIIFFSILVLLFVPPLVKQGTSLIDNWPETTDRLVANINNSNEAPYKFIRDHGILDYVQEHKEQIKDGLTSFFGSSLEKAIGLLGSVGALFTIFAMAIYMSANGPSYAKALKRRIPKRHHKAVEQLVKKMYSAVTGYVNGNLAVSGIAGVCAGLVAAIVELPYPALLGLIVAFMDLIPMIGATLGAVVVVIIAMFTSLPAAAVMAVFFAIYQQLENYVIVPRVMGKTVEMSSFAVFIAALSGGVLAGFIGALVAIPIGACIQILVNYFLQKKFA